MRKACPYRGENHGPGKDRHRELDPKPGIREQPGSNEGNPALQERLFSCPMPTLGLLQAQIAGQIPPHALQDHCAVKMAVLNIMHL
jgi:hypothetical protein